MSPDAPGRDRQGAGWPQQQGDTAASGKESSSQHEAPTPQRLPVLSLPKGGGAIRGIGEKFAANPVTGTGSMTVPIATSPGRSGFGPQLSLSYDSGTGNGPFGFGWSLSLPSITRKTDKGLPRYLDAGESDVFILSGAEDLVPEFEKDDAGAWVTKDGSHVIHDRTRKVEDVTYRVRRYRPRIEGLFARIERWTNQQTGEIHWRSISRDNVTTVYGRDNSSRIFDPTDKDYLDRPRCIFSWLICESYDDKGNAIVYEYAAENDNNVDHFQANERNRVRTANRYLKRIKYGNRVSRLVQPDLAQMEWLFEVVFDYDEGHYEEVDLDPARPEAEQHRFVRASALPGRSWAVRPDPFSSYRAGFEVRAYRRARRVLQFHHIPDLPTGEKGYDGLVRSTEFDYADLGYRHPVGIEGELAHQGSTRFASFIRAVTQSGYVRDDTPAVVVRNGGQYATYLKKSLPPLEFEYSKAAIQDQVLELDAESLENLPVGLDGSTYQWVDLDGEGVSGILTEQAGAWFYKPNLGDGRFGPLQTVAAKPSLAALSGGRQQLLDVAGDGQLDLVMLAGPTPGFYERTYDEDWAPFRTFRQKPNIPWGDPNLRFVDLDGDGHADVLITEHDVFTWYPSLAEEGFGPARRVAQALDEEIGPRLVFADGTESIYFADMSGDGLTDLVRVRNHEVSYWPNLGYGRFGAKVAMDHVPWFDHPEQFDQRRVRLADIDGSGTTDIIYLHREGARLYFNQSGNRLSEARHLAQFPPVDNISSVMTADLLGNGTACLVWSSPLPADAHRPLCFVDLMGSSSAFSLTDLVNFPSLASKLAHPARPVDSWLASQLSTATAEALANYEGAGADPAPLRTALLSDLNHLVFGSSIHEPERFAGLVLRLETETLLSQSPRGSDVLRLNRLLLEDAYPLEFARFRCAKPHLLIKSLNNLGAETLVQYAPSTKFYLADKLAGKPWITRVPFPVHVVKRVETYDRISGNRFVTRYAYHHGYFDSIEREARGWGMVEQWDTEEFAALNASGQAPTGTNVEASSHVPPVLTKTWFHTGVYLSREHVSDFFAGFLDANDVGEYYREPGLTDAQARALLLDDTVLPDGLTVEEEREACRALKGSMLRQEVYALDGTVKQQHPYTVTEQNFTIRPLQPRGDNRHGVFFTHGRESISYHYERDPADPRIGHALTLEVDASGNVLKSAAIGYGRRKRIRVVDDQGDVTEVPNPGLSELDPRDQGKQTTILITYTENRVTNAVEIAGDHRTPLPCESRTHELTGLTLPAGSNRFTFHEVLDAGATAIALDYEKDLTAGRREKRLIEHMRTYYRRNDLAGPLPLGALQSLALPFESYKLAFTPGLVAQAYGVRASEAMLKDDGRYAQTEGDANWWISSGRIFYSPDPDDTPPEELAYARQHFILPHRYRDPFHTDVVSTENFVAYDRYNLLVQETTDGLGNQVTVGERRRVLPDGTVMPETRRNDYRVLQPALVMDPNRNCSEVRFDALGMVVGTAVMGKPEEQNPRPGDQLDRLFHPDPTQAETEAFFEKPREASPNPDESVATQIVHDLLGTAMTRVVYDLDRYKRLGEPIFAATVARETHVSDLQPNDKSKLQISFSYSDGFGREIQKKIQAEPGPGPQRDSNGKIIVGLDGRPQMTPNDVSPRWVGSGWTVFNNKGKPVRQYEPFFTDTHRFELDVKLGVSPVLFYDPVERVVATLHPNHTWEKVIFDPWREETWDVNDTILVADPKADADVGGFFSRLPSADYLPTWHTLRTNAANAAAFAARYPDPTDRTNETRAAENASVHAGTPTIAHADSLGRTFLTVAHNTFKYSDTPSADPPVEEFHRTRIILDIEGNQREVVDAEDRVVMRYDYDMLGNRVHQASMEAGERWMLNDVAGKALYAWDSRDHRFRTAYDPLRRPTDSFLSEGAGAEIVFGRSICGESRPNPEASNLRGKVVELRDQAGVLTSDLYDFKGNLLRSQRQLARDYKTTLDWSGAVPLEPETYTSRTRYDALNRPTQLIAPHSDQPGTTVNVVQPSYNEANLLEQIQAWLNRNAEPGDLLDPASANLHAVTDIDYDAKGRRLLIDYGKGVRTTCTYDPLTFRLTHLLTRRKAAAFPNDCPEPPPAGWPGCQVQNLRYTYDPAGNITHIRDDAQQTIYFRNKRVEPTTEYAYDAIYRLIEATGREHLGQVGGAPIPHSYNDAPRVGVLSGDAAGRFSPNDGNAMGRYLERYVYDAVGNFLKMKHCGTDPVHPTHPCWTRTYRYNEPSQLEPGKQSNRLSSTQVGNGRAAAPELYAYDAHGSTLRMPHLQVMQWDLKDQLQMSQRQKVSDEDADGVRHHGERTWYVYDSAGQRVRKVTEVAAGQVKDERIYLGGFEVYRKNGVNPLVRETLHIMDDKQRIALVETRTQGYEPGVPQQLIRYQFGNHLGSASLELDDQAQIISYEEYAPYGSSTCQAVRSYTESAKRYRYTGKERDEESGLYYHGARYLAVWLGRWCSADPTGIADSLSQFSYVRGSPVRLRDSSGRASSRSELTDSTVATIEKVSLSDLKQDEPTPEEESSGMCLAAGYSMAPGPDAKSEAPVVVVGDRNVARSTLSSEMEKMRGEGLEYKLDLQKGEYEIKFGGKTISTREKQFTNCSTSVLDAHSRAAGGDTERMSLGQFKMWQGIPPYNQGRGPVDALVDRGEGERVNSLQDIKPNDIIQNRKTDDSGHVIVVAQMFVDDKGKVVGFMSYEATKSANSCVGGTDSPAVGNYFYSVKGDKLTKVVVGDNGKQRKIDVEGQIYIGRLK